MRWRGLAVPVAVLLVVLIGGFYSLRIFAISAAEKKFMLVHRNGTMTPAQFGAAWTPFTIDSDGRTLQASLVMAQPSCTRPVAVLLFHGRDESLSDWAKAQAFPSRECVSSVMFDYSGNGDSTGPATMANLNADGIAAWRAFMRKFPTGRRCVLAHSMGNAVMLNDLRVFAPLPDCAVDANAFSSVEDFVRYSGAPSAFALLLHGVWDNTQAIKAVKVPLLVIHSDADQTIPAFMSTRIAEAAPAGAKRVTLHGFSYDALYEDPSLASWTPVLAFLRGK
ncbi:MAG TPA: alpha/beta hydrolase [Rhizomicrobium sp.]|nr:alpha/beta hydrolase [Rhizomicrobium sp.]